MSTSESQTIPQEKMMEHIKAGELKAARAMLNSGVPPTEVHKPGHWGAETRRAPLHTAIRLFQRSPNEDVMSLIKLLLDKGANTNDMAVDRNWKGTGSSESAFQMALEHDLRDVNGKAELTTLLLQHGADASKPKVQDIHSMRTDGRITTPLLHMAVSLNHLGLARALLEAKADVNAKYTESISNERSFDEDRRETALNSALNGIKTDRKNDSMEMIQLLLEHGVDVNYRSTYLRHDPNPEYNEEDDEDDPRDESYIPSVINIQVSFTAIHQAVLGNRPDIVALLVRHGANVDARYLEEPYQFHRRSNSGAEQEKGLTALQLFKEKVTEATEDGIAAMNDALEGRGQPTNKRQRT